MKFGSLPLTGPHLSLQTGDGERMMGTDRVYLDRRKDIGSAPTTIIRNEAYQY